MLIVSALVYKTFSDNIRAVTLLLPVMSALFSFIDWVPLTFTILATLIAIFGLMRRGGL
jgi:hypothetical protein